MRVAIHQPNFIPWFGYFYKIAQVDRFVFLNHVEHTKRSYTRRVLILHPNFTDEEYIRLYLAKSSDFTPINELQIANGIDWQQKIIVQLENTYRNAPYFQETMHMLKDIFILQTDMSSLSEINTSIIIALAKKLNLATRFTNSTDLLPLNTNIHINLAICNSLKACTYVSGMGAKKYQDDAAFIQNGIHLEYISPNLVFESFNIREDLQNKSIISWLMYYTIDELKEMLSHQV